MNRELQKKILFHLEEIYPDTPIGLWDSLLEFANNDERNLIREVLYLEERGLILSGLDETMDGVSINESGLKITADGRDFLEADGGLRAALNVVTVKLHPSALDTIERLLDSANPSASAEMKARLRQLPAVATEQLVGKLVELGLKNAPDALVLIRSFL